jgi:hypothetical protein
MRTPEILHRSAPRDLEHRKALAALPFWGWMIISLQYKRFPEKTSVVFE